MFSKQNSPVQFECEYSIGNLWENCIVFMTTRVIFTLRVRKSLMFDHALINIKWHNPTTAFKVNANIILNKMDFKLAYIAPDSKVHGANMGPTWVLSAPDGPHVGPMNFAIWGSAVVYLHHIGIIQVRVFLLVGRQHACTWNNKFQWRHNEHDGLSNHQRFHCLLNCRPRRRSKKTPKLRVTGLCVGNSPVTGEFPAQKASNAENVSI